MSEFSLREESRKMLRLLKFTRQWKQNVGVMIFFYVLGIFFTIMGGFNTFLGGFYLVLGGTMLIGAYEQMFFTSYMNTSPRHRYYSGRLYLMFSAAAFTVGYILEIICLWVKELLINREWDEHMEEWILKWNKGMESGTILVFIGILGMITAIYFNVLPKAYISSIIIFFGGFYTIFMIMMNAMADDIIDDNSMDIGTKLGQLHISLGKGAVIGYVLILAGLAIGSLIRKALYNRQYSPLYKKAFLRTSK